MKILSVGDSPKTNTGYGTVNRYLLAYLASIGHEVLHVTWGHNEPPERVKSDTEGHSYTLYPAYLGSGGFVAACTTVESMIPQLQPDIYMNGNDYFTAYNMPGLKLKAYRSMEHFPLWLHYGIIDGYDHAISYPQIITSIDKPLVATQYAYDQVVKLNPNAEIIPYGYDSNIFYKQEEDKIEQTKLALGIKDRFVIGAANRNIIRKKFPLLMKLYSEFKKEHDAKDSILFMLCDPKDPPGFDLTVYAKKFGLSFTNNPQKVNDKTDILFHPKYISALMNLSVPELADVYNTFDIHMSLSQGEGFGLTTLETMACGKPNVIMDNTANTELVKGRGWLYSTARNMDGSPVYLPGAGNTPYMMEIADVVSAKIALIEAYKSSVKREQFSKKCLEFVKTLTWSEVLPQWGRVMSEIEEAIE